MNLRILTAMCAVAAALTIAAQARADLIDFWLTQQECSAACSPTIPVANAVEVGVNLNMTTQVATITFTAPSGVTFEAPLELNINGDYSATSSLGITTQGSEDTYGVTSLETGSSSSITSATITLTAEGGNTWASAANVLTPTCPVEVATPSCVVGYNDPSSENQAGNSTGYGSQYPAGLEAVVAENSYTGHQSAGYYATPAPSIGYGVPGILAVAGVLFGAGLMKRGRKRGSFGVPYAA
jgi:hypothetical protein